MRPRRPRLLPSLVGLLALLAFAAPAAAKTVVSLTFDDSTADQYQVAPLLAAHGMHATFYVITGALGDGAHLTVPELQSLQAAGNEIAGHTVTHPDLSSLSPTEQAREICGARDMLLANGLRVTSFAYPYADIGATTEQIVRSCGYNSARGVGGLISPHGCLDCAPAEDLPPDDPYDIQTPAAVGGTTTLSELEGLVTQAEKTGKGWVPLVFHELCEGCDPDYNISLPLLSSFLDWLAPRAAQGTVVQTVDQVMGGAVKPAVPAPPIPPPPPAGANMLQNPSLESAAASGMPACWQAGGFGTNTPTWTSVATAHSGAVAERIDLANRESGDASFTSLQDLGDCAPAATTGHTYRVGAWYSSTSSPSLLAYYMTASGQWRFWAQSPPLPAAADWTEGTWYTPPAPPDAVALSVGVALPDQGTLLVDDLSLVDAPAAPSPRPPPPAGTNLLLNSSLEATVDGVPTCWQLGGFGANTPVWSLTAGHAGSVAEHVDVSGLTSGDAAFVSQQDLGACSPAATPGHVYRLSAWYQATAPVDLLTYVLGADGQWRFWGQSPPLAPAAAWTEGAWVTPPAPPDAVELGVGVALPSDGSLSVDDLALVDVPADGPAPSAAAGIGPIRIAARPAPVTLRRLRLLAGRRGRVLTFDLSTRATVRLTVARSLARRRVGAALASVTVHGKAGRNRVLLPLRLRRRLAVPGAYWLIARIGGKGGASARVRVVVPRHRS